MRQYELNICFFFVCRFAVVVAKLTTAAIYKLLQPATWSEAMRLLISLNKREVSRNVRQRVYIFIRHNIHDINIAIRSHLEFSCFYF